MFSKLPVPVNYNELHNGVIAWQLMIHILVYTHGAQLSNIGEVPMNNFCLHGPLACRDACQDR